MNRGLDPWLQHNTFMEDTVQEKDPQIKIRLTRDEAAIIAEAVRQRPGESLALALKKYFNTKDHIKKVGKNGPQQECK